MKPFLKAIVAGITPAVIVGSGVQATYGPVSEPSHKLPTSLVAEDAAKPPATQPAPQVFEIDGIRG